MARSDYVLSVLPLVPSLLALHHLWRHCSDSQVATLYTVAQSCCIGVLGYLLTDRLVPVVGAYTLRKGLCGLDMGKKGTAGENDKVPEALGIVSGVVYLVCAIFSQLLFFKDNANQLIIFNSALFSVCFMIFLGFTDDTLDLLWRYKLILPTVASLPLLVTYSGNTALYVPEPFRWLLYSHGEGLTTLGKLIDNFITVDVKAGGAIVELGYFFLLFMGLLSVFCTNAINIYAGINGIECGQAYVIACSVLFFKLYDIINGESGDNQIFSVLMVIPFIGTSLALLRHNWFPAKVFVGDTFCYFSGMTFAVIGIHGHFSKTLLLLFVPQILNFLLSVPQLFRLGGIVCPRHRLPRVDASTRLMHPSTFPCAAGMLPWLKVRRGDTECPNLTLICLALRLCGPMRERSLTIALLALQVLCSALAFVIRYRLLA